MVIVYYYLLYINTVRSFIYVYIYIYIYKYIYICGDENKIYKKKSSFLIFFPEKYIFGLGLLCL